MLDVSYQSMMKLAYLLDSSTVVPAENIFHIISSIANNSMKNNLLKNLLHNLPIYHIFLSIKEYVVNYHETIFSEVIDKITSVTGYDKYINILRYIKHINICEV